MNNRSRRLFGDLLFYFCKTEPHHILHVLHQRWYQTSACHVWPADSFSCAAGNTENIWWIMNKNCRKVKLEKLENIWVAVVPLISRSLPVWFQWDSFTNNHIVVKFTLHPLVQLGNTIVVMFKEIQSKYTRMRFPKYQSNRSKSKKWVSRFKI